MTVIGRFLLQTASILLSFVVCTSLTLGCSCVADHRSVAEVYSDTDQVFVGKVIGINWVEKADVSYPIMEKHASWVLSKSKAKMVSFEIAEPFKVVEGNNASVLTECSSAACGVDFEVGKTYLVYANRRSNVCDYISGLAKLDSGDYAPDVRKELKEIDGKITVGMLYDMETLNKQLPIFSASYCSRTRELLGKDAQLDLKTIRDIILKQKNSGSSKP